MKKKLSTIDNSKIATILLVINSLFLVIWLLGNNTNLSRVPLMGIIYEALWLPLLICLFISPVMAFVYWKRELFSFKSWFGYLLIMALLLIILLFTVYN